MSCIKKTMLSIEDEGGSIFKCDTILHENEPWLVVEWIGAQSAKAQRPKRIVRLGAFEYQVLTEGSPFGSYIIKYPIPKDVYYGPTPEAYAHDVIEDLAVLIQKP